MILVFVEEELREVRGIIIVCILQTAVSHAEWTAYASEITIYAEYTHVFRIVESFSQREGNGSSFFLPPCQEFSNLHISSKASSTLKAKIRTVRMVVMWHWKCECSDCHYYYFQEH